MSDASHMDLTRRERQIMDIVYRKERATAVEVMKNLPSPPGYSAVRAMLRLLTEKGYLEYEQDGPRYVYAPTVGREKASRSALMHLLRTFFGGSVEQAVSALLDVSEPSGEELARLSRLIRRASEEEGR